MKTYGGLDVRIHVFFTSALAGGGWPASRPCRFTCGKKPRYPLQRRLGEAQNQSRRCGGEKNRAPADTRTPDSQFHANWRQVASFVLMSSRPLTDTLVDTRLIHAVTCSCASFSAKPWICTRVCTLRSILSNPSALERKI
jgi:hypothetical protein